MMAIIEKMQQQYPKRFICKILRITRSSYYDWQQNVKMALVKTDQEMRNAVKALALKRPYYGYRRITHALKREGLAVNYKQIYLIMKEESILCKRKRKYVKTTNSNHAGTIYPNLAAKIIVTDVNQLWAGDITYIPLSNRFVYLATITDVFSRKCIGWDLDIRIDELLCVNALKKALINRKGANLNGLIHHSDRGSQYASLGYVQLLKNNNIGISMSRKGNPYDNSYAERLFKTFKYETFYFHECETFDDVYQLVKAFVADYNGERLHSAIGYRPPDEFEKINRLKI